MKKVSKNTKLGKEKVKANVTEKSSKTTKKSTKDNKESKTDIVRKELLKKFGANLIRTGTDLVATKLPRLSTGSVELDDKLGGGTVLGRVIHIVGQKSVGKSTLALHIAECAQKYEAKYKWVNRFMDGNREVVELIDAEINGLTVAYIDLEGTFDHAWAESVGVDVDKLIYIPASGLEETSDVISALQQAGVELIILDSVDALISQKDVDRDSGESMQMGEKQKEMGRILRKFVSYNNKLSRDGKVPSTLILLNQLRDKIGVMFGSPSFAGGGNAIGFYSSTEIYVRSGENIKIGTGKLARTVGREVKFKIEKNKTYVQFLEGAFDMYFKTTKGHVKGSYDNAKSIVLLCVEYGIIVRKGGWYSFDGENIAQGANALILLVNSDEALATELKRRLNELIASGGADIELDADAQAEEE